METFTPGDIFICFLWGSLNIAIIFGALARLFASIFVAPRSVGWVLISLACLFISGVSTAYWFEYNF